MSILRKRMKDTNIPPSKETPKKAEETLTPRPMNRIRNQQKHNVYQNPQNEYVN